ncbi:calcium-binding protein [Actinoplanes sp. NPDC024001]|uniref:calcium-binding protein n=1 Tax=Actinoplanes sp. NPDC024001 TaxID=3154598 RepID=UPI00340B3D12
MSRSTWLTRVGVTLLTTVSVGVATAPAALAASTGVVSAGYFSHGRVEVKYKAATGKQNKVSGGSGHDHLHGGSGNDRISGFGGSDLVYAGSGNDVVYAGSGGDHVRGRSGNDRVYGRSGNDHLHGDQGYDYLDGGADHDTLTGDDYSTGTAADVLVGGQRPRHGRLLGI